MSPASMAEEGSPTRPHGGAVPARPGSAWAAPTRPKGNTAVRRVFAAALRPLRLDRDSLVSRQGRAWGTGSALAFAVSLGLQLTVLAMLALGPLAEPFAASTLTAMGQKNMRPENDLLGFYAGCVTTVALSWAAVRLFETRLAGLTALRAERAARRASRVQGVLAAASLGLFSSWAQAAGASVTADGRLSGSTLARLALPGILALALLLADHVVARRGLGSAP